MRNPFSTLAALLGDAGFDAIDVVAHVHAIGDGALVVVLGHAVLMEVGDGLRRGRGGQADEKGVEVFQYLPPEVVDRAVAFIGDDEVELLDGHGRVVGDIAGAGAAQRGGQLGAGEIVRAFREFLAAQDGVEALDGADGDAANVVDVGRGQVLHVVQLGEEPAGVGGAVAMELVAGLFAEVRAVDQKQDAARARVLDQPIGERASGEGLARAGGHVDEGTGAAFGE